MSQIRIVDAFGNPYFLLIYNILFSNDSCRFVFGVEYADIGFHHSEYRLKTDIFVGTGQDSYICRQNKWYERR